MSASRTSVTVGVVARVLIRKTSLVWEGMDDLDPHLAAPTVSPGGGNGVADAAVHQPAGAALVQALSPGCVQLARCSQGAVQFLTVLHCLLIGEAVVVTSEEDLTWK